MSTSNPSPDQARDWQLPWTGGCRCGRVRLRISAPPLLSMACHCTGCQTMSASAFSLSIAIPTQGFEVVSGEPVIGGLHGADSHHYFCPHCKSWMFTRAEGLDPCRKLRTTLLYRHAAPAPAATPWRTPPTPRAGGLS